MSAGSIEQHTLRDYQVECIEAHYTALENTRHPLFEVPTGGGKSLIIAKFIQQAVTNWPKTRVLVLTHVKELIEQNHDELVANWGPSLCPVGIWSAGVGRRESHAQIVYAGIQSCVGPLGVAEDMLQHFDLVLIDEAHLVPKGDSGRYRAYIAALMEINPKLRVIGYTATPYRLDGGLLHRGPGSLFTDIGYSVSVDRLIRQGYLCNLRSKRAEHQIDTSSCRTRAGDWTERDLQLAATGDGMVRDAIAEAVETLRSEGRKSWLVFAIGIDHADEIVRELAVHGVIAETVYGKTPKDERSERVRRFKSGDLACLVNVGCLTTGFNAPRCDAGIILRPTQSVALYVQMMGRFMRPFPGKVDALILDYGTNVARHGPVNRIEVVEDGEKARAETLAPTKACPQCREEIPLACRLCPACGFDDFPPMERDGAHETRASDLSPVAWDDHEPEPLKVTAITCQRHEKVGSPPSMRVTYVAGMHPVDEWICFEHDGYALAQAIRWWLQRGGLAPQPDTVDEALDRLGELTAPSHAVIKRSSKYWRVSDLRYEPTELTYSAVTPIWERARKTFTDDEIPF